MKDLKKLIYIPILHSMEDEVHAPTKSKLSKTDDARKLPAAEEMWKGIASKMMEISIHINPSEVLERAQQGKIDIIQYQKLSDDLDKIVIKLIVKEIRRRFTVRVMDFFIPFLPANRCRLLLHNCLI